MNLDELQQAWGKEGSDSEPLNLVFEKLKKRINRLTGSGLI